MSDDGRGHGESRLLTRLKAAIAAERDASRAACLRAELAGVYARQGQPDAAKADLATLRAEFGQRPLPELMVWLCMGEAWLAHYTDLSDAARDRMKRALALSTAYGLRRLAATSAAWLSHFEYFRDSPEQMAAYLKTALDAPEDADHGALARAHLVAAMAYHFGGRFDLAQGWYVKASRLASAVDDDVLLSALTGNMGAMRCIQAQQAAIFGEPFETEARFALIASESAGNFDLKIGTESFSSIVPYVKAAMASVQGRLAESIEIYGGVLPGLDAEGLSDLRPQILADMAWCYVQLGDAAEGMAHVLLAEQSLGGVVHAQDVLVAKGRLRQVAARLGDGEREARYGAEALRALDAHRKLQVRFVEAVDRTLVSLKAMTG